MMDEKQSQEEDQKDEQSFLFRIRKIILHCRTKMFKRENRLVYGVKFNNSYNFSVPQFILKTKNNGILLNRFGIVVSKKIDKRAVVRNKIKRIFRSALVDLNKNMSSGHDILFVVKLGIINKTKEEIYLLIKQALEKARLMKMRSEK